jgi:hypothetical protein
MFIETHQTPAEAAAENPVKPDLSVAVLDDTPF